MGYQEYIVRVKSQKRAIKTINKLKEKLKDNIYINVGNIIVKSRSDINFTNSKNNIEIGNIFVLIQGDRFIGYNIANSIANKKNIYSIDEILFNVSNDKLVEYKTQKMLYEHCFDDVPIKQRYDIQQKLVKNG